MSEELQQKLRDQLWEVANKLRGNMSASDFMYFTLGFIFYKYLSEKIGRMPMTHWWTMKSGRRFACPGLSATLGFQPALAK